MTIALLRRKQPDERRHHKRAKADANKRLDIQGLRAFAVLVVVADHLWHWPTGGFAGVDVFFVISGFLITGLLLREWEKTEGISFVNFYARRIKRIVPAATVVLVFTVVAAKLVTSDAIAGAVRIDAISAFFFVSNWRFLSVGTDYFQQDLPPSPLQHYWSLSVEEQFYFVWPWLMLGILLILARLRVRMRWDRRVAAMVMGAIVVASFAYGMAQSASQPTAAYFSSFTRAWELGVGALLACVAPVLTRLPQVGRRVLLWVGLIGLFSSLFLISSDSTWPAPWAALPVASTALVIASGTGGSVRFNPILTNRPAQYLGDLSYSLYLWHFPLIVLIGYVMSPSWWRDVVTLVFVAGFSVCAYHGIEKPIHTSPLFVKYTDGEKKSRAWRTWKESIGRRSAPGVLGLVALVSAILVQQSMTVGAVATSATPPTVITQATESPVSVPPPPPLPSSAKPLQARIAQAVAAASWPQFNPALDKQMDDFFEPGVDACNKRDLPVATRACTFGSANASHTAVIAGDSIAAKWANLLVRMYQTRDWKIVVLSKYGCPLNMSSKATAKERQASCTAAVKSEITAINDLRPDLLFISNTHLIRGDASIQEWKDGFSGVADRLTTAKKIVVLTPPPSAGETVDPKVCITPRSSPSACLTTVPAQWQYVFQAEWQALQKHDGAIVVDTRPLFGSSQLTV